MTNCGNVFLKSVAVIHGYESVFSLLNLDFLIGW